MEIKKTIETMFTAGAHFGLGRSRRHPTVSPYIFGTKNTTDIFDLEKTADILEKTKAIIVSLAKESKTVLFIGGKKEASIAVKNAAMSINMPYVDGRWIGGTLSNFGQIRKRVDRYEKLIADKEKGELVKYTKRERMLIDKEIASLEKMFYGIVGLKKIPEAVFIIDPRREKNAVKEAQDMGVTVIALAGSDCNISEVKYPIVGNDASKASIQFFLGEIVKAYQAGKVK
ncbi:MAG: 30S ribosomal protein S2 [Patescibacteria group bacterium]